MSDPNGPSGPPQDPLRHLDDPDVILARLGEAVARCAETLSAAPPLRHAVGRWNVADLAGHLGVMVDAYVHLMQGGGHPAGRIEDLGAFNDRMAAERGGDPVAAAERMRAEADTMLARMRQRWDEPIPWLSDIVIDGRTVAVVALGEFLVHGHDAAGGSDWAIDPLDTSILLAGIEPMAVHYVNEEEAADLRAVIEVRVRRGAARDFVFDGPRLSIGEPGQGPRPDCYISGDATTLVLLMYGRAGPVAAALRGKVIAWGRRPWLALRLPKLIRNP